MSFSLHICNNSMEFNYFDSLSVDESGKCIHNETNIENPNYNEVDKIFNDFFFSL